MGNIQRPCRPAVKLSKRKDGRLIYLVLFIMFEPDAPSPKHHVTQLPTATKPITISGYIQAVADNSMTIVGCNPSSWADLPREYFFRGVRRHVTGDRTSCTITISTKTIGPATQSAYVKVTALATPYKFWGDGALISGWTLRAISIKKIPIPGYT